MDCRASLAMTKPVLAVTITGLSGVLRPAPWCGAVFRQHGRQAGAGGAARRPGGVGEAARRIVGGCRCVHAGEEGDAVCGWHCAVFGAVTCN